MSNSATQNPSNKVGRNSGAGAGGVSEVVPSAAEARRGLEPVQSQATLSSPTPSGSSGGGFGKLGVVTLLGAGIAALVTRRVRQPRSRLDRLRGFVSRKGSSRSKRQKVLDTLKFWEK